MDATMFDPQLDHLGERGYRAITYDNLEQPAAVNAEIARFLGRLDLPRLRRPNDGKLTGPALQTAGN